MSNGICIFPRLNDAANLLVTAFPWNLTREGHSYWSGVRQILTAMAEGRESLCPLPVSVEATPHLSGASIQVELVRQLLEIVRTEIAWAHTPQGSTFWANVACRLDAVIDAGERLARSEDLTDDPASTLASVGYVPQSVSTETMKRFGSYINPVDIDETLERIRTAGSICIGAGDFGDVFNMPGDDSVVIKVSKAGQSCDDGWQHFVQVVMDFAEDNPHLPKVHSLIRCERPNAKETFFVALMERLKPFGDRPSGVPHDVAETLFCNVSDRLRDRRPNAPLPDAMTTAVELIRTKGGNYKIDLHRGNVMWRGNTLVITDPLVYPSEKPYSRYREAA